MGGHGSKIKVEIQKKNLHQPNIDVELLIIVNDWSFNDVYFDYDLHVHVRIVGDR